MIITFSHQKGGVGKSTLAWNLSVLLQKKYNIQLVDLDAQKTLTIVNNIRAKNPKLKMVNVRSFENKEELLAYIKNDSDDRLSIIDVGGFDSNINRIAIAYADIVITPVSDKEMDLFGLQSFERILGEISESINDKVVVKVLLNDINPQKSKLEDIREFITRSSHFELLDTVIRTRADFAHSVGKGMSVVEYNEDGKASKEAKSLAKEIKKLLKG